jgi:hypothetical protein
MAETPRLAIAVMGGAAALLLALALAFRSGAGVAVALAALGGVYAVGLVLGPAGIDRWTPLAAGLLALAAELAFSSIEPSPELPLMRRAGEPLAVAAAGTALAALLLGAAAGGSELGVAGALAGTIAVVGAVVLVTRLGSDRRL